MVHILRMRPRVPSRSILLSPPPQFSRGATPMKQGDPDTSPILSPLQGVMSGGGAGPNSQSYPNALKPEQERDISIFRSFCALKLVLDAVWNSVLLRDGMMPTAPDNINRQSDEKDFTASMDSTFLSSLSAGTHVSDESTDVGQIPTPTKHSSSTKVVRKLELGPQRGTLNVNKENLSYNISEEVPGVAVMDSHKILYEKYKWCVSECLQEAKLYLAHVFPLNYRLEVLEDIFSLLFLTSSDVKLTNSSVGVDQDKHVTDNPFHSLSGGSRSSFMAQVQSRNEFLVDERLASDLLEFLQDCIHELRAAKYAQSQQSDASPNEGDVLICDGVRSSVSEASLKARTTRLEQYVNEARWRLQMVLSELTTTSYSKVRNDQGSLEEGVNNCLSGSDEDSGSLFVTESDLEWNEEEIMSIGKGRKALASSSSPELRDDVSDNVDLQRSVSSLNSCHSSIKMVQPPSASLKASSSSPSVVIPAPMPSGFVQSTYNRDSPTLKELATKQKQNWVSTSLPLGSSGSKSNGSDGANHSRVRRQSSQPVDHEDDSGDRADVEDRSINVSPPKNKKKKRVRKRTRSQSSYVSTRKHGLHLTEKSSEPKPSRSSFVSRMLSSAGSLLRVCLRHSNYMKAGEVVRTLHMEGQFGEAIMHFSEQFEAVGRELSQHSRVDTPSRAKHLSPSSSSHSLNVSRSVTPHRSTSPMTLLSTSAGQGYGFGQIQEDPAFPMNLQVAIMNAKSSYDPLQSLHRLLAPPTVYQMLFSGDSELECMVDEDKGLQQLAEHVPSLIMLDMACSHKICGSIATKMLEMATDRLHGDSSNINDISGPFALLKLLSDASIHYPQAASCPTQTLVPPSHLSPHSLLTLSTHTLNTVAISQVKAFSDVYRVAREKLEAEINIGTAEIHTYLAGKEGEDLADVFFQLTQLVTSEESPAPSSSLAAQQQILTSGSMFDELVRALHSVPPVHLLYPATSVTPRGDRLLDGVHHHGVHSGPELGMVSYLWHFSLYISRLIKLLGKCLNIKGTSKNSVHPQTAMYRFKKIFFFNFSGVVVAVVIAVVIGRQIDSSGLSS